MLAHERQQQILESLVMSGSIRISEIVETYNVSNETARRDLEYLQRKGYVARIHGGAKLIAKPSTPYVSQETEDVSETDPALLVREMIGRVASDYVEDGDILFIGHGTTMTQFSRFIKAKKNLTVLTNSISVINELIDSSVTIYALGGLINNDEYNMSGSIPISVIQNFYATKTFISCGGISLSGNVSDYHNDGTMQKLMLAHSQKKYLVADSDKFGSNAFCSICQVSDFDAVITDSKLAPAFQELLAQSNTQLQTVDVN